MRYLPTLIDAVPITLDGRDMVAFSDGVRAHTVSAEEFHVYYRPATPADDWNDWVRRTEARFAAEAKAVDDTMLNYLHKGSEALREPLPQTVEPEKPQEPAFTPRAPPVQQRRVAREKRQAVAKPVSTEKPQPDLNQQIIAALKAHPMEYTELLERFQILGTKPCAAFYARIKTLADKGLLIAPPKFSGAAWRAA